MSKVDMTIVFFDSIEIYFLIYLFPTDKKIIGHRLQQKASIVIR